MTVSRSADDLRAAFDGGFRAPPPDQRRSAVELLAVRIGGDPHVLRIAEIAGLFVDRAITKLPTRARALLGLAGFRGVILPVFDLAELLGYPRAATPRWMIVTARSPIALAFEEFEGHVVLDRVDGETVQIAGISRAVVALAAAVDKLTTKER